MRWGLTFQASNNNYYLHVYAYLIVYRFTHKATNKIRVMKAKRKCCGPYNVLLVVLSHEIDNI